MTDRAAFLLHLFLLKSMWLVPSAPTGLDPAYSVPQVPLLSATGYNASSFWSLE